jgi:hypothetical protein
MENDPRAQKSQDIPTERAGSDATSADPSDAQNGFGEATKGLDEAISKPVEFDLVASGPPDFITILTTADNKRLAKRHYLDAEGAPQTADYDRAYLVMMRRVQIFSLADVCRVMSEIKTNECIVWGRQLVDEIAVVRRLYQDEVNGDKATIADTPHHVLFTDFDLKPEQCPPGLTLLANPTGCIEHCISLLPPEFKGAACVAQLTGSAGVKPGIRLRLVFWLEQPITGEQAREYLKGTAVDLAIYTPNQPIYAAAPIFEKAGLTPWRGLTAALPCLL